MAKVTKNIQYLMIGRPVDRPLQVGYATLDQKECTWLSRLWGRLHGYSYYKIEKTTVEWPEEELKTNDEVK